jgi:hypothetical protein
VGGSWICAALRTVLLVLGQFEVAVETSKGYFVATFPDTETGVTEFLQAIRPALEAEPGRFYPCVTYDGPARTSCKVRSRRGSALCRSLEPASGIRVSGMRRGSFATTESPHTSRAAPWRSWT